MSFGTVGLALAGLIAMAIPIVVHLLFRQRRRPVQWAAMRFLLEAFRKHRRRLQFEQFLLLALRCLAVALLGFALARPMLSEAGLIDTGSSRSVYIMLDNGMTSGAINEEDTTILQSHIGAAVEIIESLGASDAVAVFTTARPGNALVHPPSTDHGGIIRLLRSLEPTDIPTDFPAALATVRRAMDASENMRDQTLVYLFSDFRAGSADLDTALPAVFENVSENTQLFASPPGEEPIPNVQIAHIDPVRSVIVPGTTDGSGQVTVHLARHGGALGETVSRVRLETGLTQSPEPKIVRWSPGESETSVDFLINIPTTDRAELQLAASIDHDRLPADDERFAVLTLRDRIGVLLIDRRSFTTDRSIEELSAGQWIRRALEPVAQGSPMEFIEVEPAALSRVDLRGADVMFITRPDLLDDNAWQLVREFTDQGGLTVLIPPGEARVHQWVDQLQTQLALPWELQLEITEHAPPLFLADEQPREPVLRMLSSELAELLRPISVYRTLPVISINAHGRAMLEFDDGAPALLAGVPAEQSSSATTNIHSAGMVMLFTFSPQLNWTNLPAKPLMVPLFQELTRQGLSQIRASRQATVGIQQQLGLPVGASDLIGMDNETRIAVTKNGSIDQPLSEAGLYTIVDRAAQKLGTLAVNVDAQAGRTQTQTDAAVLSWLAGSGDWKAFEPANMTVALAQIDRGSPLAHLFLIIVLVLLILETALARLFSHSNRAGAAQQSAHGTGFTARSSASAPPLTSGGDA